MPVYLSPSGQARLHVMAKRVVAKSFIEIVVVEPLHGDLGENEKPRAAKICNAAEQRPTDTHRPELISAAVRMQPRP
jgi:hypothetical protein